MGIAAPGCTLDFLASRPHRTGGKADSGQAPGRRHGGPPTSQAAPFVAQSLWSCADLRGGSFRTLRVDRDGRPLPANAQGPHALQFQGAPQLKCRRLLLVAHRCNSRQRSNSVAFGAKRTFSEPRLQNRI
jgi:hypothetical protein